MNILHIVPSFVPCFSAGGVVNASYEIAKKQIEQGHNVTVFTTDSCKKRLKMNRNYNQNVDGINVYYFKNFSNRFKNKFTIDSPYDSMRIIKKEINNFDIVHIHEHRHFLAIVGYYFCRKNNIPYIIQAHGSVLPFFQKEKLKEIFDKLWGFKILKNASKVFALTETEKDQYKKMQVEEDKIEIVPLGINIEDYDDLPEKGKFRKKYKIKDDEKLLVFLGRIHEIKGLDLLIESFKNIKCDVKLAIIGADYGFLSNINNLIEQYDLEEKIILTGPLYKKDKQEALVDCDIFVMPSKYESFTTSGLEAMACSKPLILTKNNHIHNWVEGNTGLTCDYNEKSLKNAIEKLLNNKTLRENFGKKGKSLIKKQYNWNIIGNKIEYIYRVIIKK